MGYDMSSSVEVKKSINILSIINGAIISIALTLIFILAFAFIIRFTNLDEKWIFPINQVIKIVSLFIGMIIAFKKNSNKGLIKGIIIGLLYYILSFVVFSILQASFSIDIKNLYDLLLTTFMSGIIGIIIINIKK